LKREQVFEFFRRLAEENPSPTTELESANPYQLLVAVVLSAQATDASVNIATRPLFARIATPREMLDLGEEALRQAIKTIGLFNTKAKNVIALSEALIRDHGGEVPCTRDQLQALPGVGRKTANVVLNTAWGEETFAVDTHVFRVCNRTGLAPGKTVDEVEAKLEKVVPQPFRRDAHHWLILHGRYTCTARKPRCPQCPVRDLCRWPDKTADL
jgi:endonuclease-3